ncbi:MAG: hypothetical protein KDB37_15160 [Ilumatobacter sp.]|nr:hypothetical protein [Ilumatobacter sp.]
MSDRFDEQMRELGRAARAEAEAALDVDTALAAIHRSTGTTSVVTAEPPQRPRVGWLAIAAAVVVAIGAGVWFARDDGAVVTVTPTVPSTVTPTVPATTPQVSPTTAATTTPTNVPATTAPTTVPATTAPSTVPTSSPVPVGQVVRDVDWRDLPWEASGIAGSCVFGESTCTQLVHDAAGVPITYEPTTRTLVRHGVPELAVTLPAAYGDAGFVVATGPDDVVYLSVAPEVPEEMAADVVAVTLTDGDAGREIGRWAGVTNTVGDSSLVPTADGLLNVGCCGTDTIRPALDAEVPVPWIDRNGEPVALESPTFWVQIEYPALIVHRRNPDGSSRSWTYEPAGDWMPRGMPNLTATFDGGFVAAEFGSDGSTLARGYADGRLDQVVLGPEFVVVDAVDPAGRILLGDVAELDDQFARVDPFANGVAAWAGEITVDTDGTIVFVDDPSDVRAGSVVAFVAAIVPPADVNEIRTIDAERHSELTWTVTVTTSNLFDDSVAAVRWELEVAQVGVATFQVTSGQASQLCSPGRGPDVFTTELCV